MSITKFDYNFEKKKLTKTETFELIGVTKEPFLKYKDYKIFREKNSKLFQKKCPICNKSFEIEEFLHLSSWKRHKNLLICESCSKQM